MKPYLLFRQDADNEEEFEIARSIWKGQITRFRSDIPPKTLVIGRYSCLPFFQDLSDELKTRSSHLLNSFRQHQYVADMEWYADLSDMTPKTWFDKGYTNVPDTEHGYVVKGRTNSRKFRWKTHMFAPDRDALKQVMERLHEDTFISEQGLVIREYAPLMKLEEGINGLPVTNEWRCFFLGTTLLSAGFYWANAECAESMSQIPEEALSLAQKAAERLQKHVNFFVVDVAEKGDGSWTVIEVNDGMMSGLSMNDPVVLYTRLKEELES
jgi:hypothetical protein